MSLFEQNFLVRLAISGGPIVVGKGSSPAFARADCLQKVLEYIQTLTPFLELGEGVWVPEREAQKVPKEVPQGHALVVVTHGSNGGNGLLYYDYRYFAVKPGRYQIDEYRELIVSEQPFIFKRLASEPAFEGLLPEGTQEYKSGKWVPV